MAVPATPRSPKPLLMSAASTDGFMTGSYPKATPYLIRSSLLLLPIAANSGTLGQVCHP